ncbi:SMU1112c/YaeR family gloxylase I-like metalloprotein [Endozoicomonas elysicola]|uniref:Lyase n=1 Tax=Endozoicomonas elysicola TaxID=305900 RepID=A0A081KGB0_9GAMM|nr:VOC family protein [Endozoicomonas elysicola]KEI73186.1 lyase [Endozoicomonas elysicola]
MITKLHHLAIIGTDKTASLYFYRDLLGFEVVGEYYQEGRESWKIDLVMSGGGQLELFIFKNAPFRLSYPEARGLRHIAFEVDDLDKTLSNLSKNGIAAEPVRVDPYTQARFTFIKDPDGLPVELYQPE